MALESMAMTDACLAFLMDQTRLLFVYFRTFHNEKINAYSTNLTVNDKSIDGALGTRTRVAGRKALMNPLSYGGTVMVVVCFCCVFCQSSMISRRLDVDEDGDSSEIIFISKSRLFATSSSSVFCVSTFDVTFSASSLPLLLSAYKCESVGECKYTCLYVSIHVCM